LNFGGAFIDNVRSHLNPALIGRVLFEKENEMNNDECDWKQTDEKLFAGSGKVVWKTETETDMSSLIPGPDAVVKYVRYQEERIKHLEIEAKRREIIINNQDIAMNQMLSSNVSISQRLDYHMLANVLLAALLTSFVGVYFW